jgi:hypothetical protein
VAPDSSRSSVSPNTTVPSAPMAHGADPAFEERWDAWVARGAAHDRAVRRRLASAAPVIAAIAAVIAYAVFGR